MCKLPYELPKNLGSSKIKKYQESQNFLELLSSSPVKAARYLDKQNNNEIKPNH